MHVVLIVCCCVVCVVCTYSCYCMYVCTGKEERLWPIVRLIIIIIIIIIGANIMTTDTLAYHDNSCLLFVDNFQ